jgi:hypothetical protein
VEYVDDPPIRPPTRIGPVLGLFVVLVIVDAVAWRWGVRHDWPSLIRVGCYALVFSQVSLVAIWIGLGATSALLRALGLAAAVGFGTLALRALHDRSGLWLVLLAIQVVAVIGPLAAARLCGIRLVREATPATRSAGRPLQFTLWHLFAGLTVTAVLMGIGRLVLPEIAGPRVYGELIVIGGGFAAIALVAVWAGLGIGAVWLKPPVLLSVSAGVGYGIAILVEGRDDVPPLVAMSVAQALCLAGSLAVVRRAGYRLVRPLRPAGNESSPQSPTSGRGVAPAGGVPPPART